MAAKDHIACPFCDSTFDPERIMISRITESHPKGFHFIYSCPNCKKLLNATFITS